MKSAFVACLIFLSITSLQAQQVQFQIQYQGAPLELEKEYQLHGEKITFSTCKFYISNIKRGNSFGDQAYRLIDIEDSNSLTIHYQKIMTFKKLSFNIGVDSAKSVSGVYGGDLDPTAGMYWTWQSGYINAKIEGNSPQCPNRKSKFQFHLGGYAFPYNGFRTVDLTLKKESKNAIVILDLENFITAVDLKTNYQVMSPSKKSMELSDLFAKAFSSND